jgi:hypothetical protein
VDIREGLLIIYNLNPFSASALASVPVDFCHVSSTRLACEVYVSEMCRAGVRKAIGSAGRERQSIRRDIRDVPCAWRPRDPSLYSGKELVKMW